MVLPEKYVCTDPASPPPTDFELLEGKALLSSSSSKCDQAQELLPLLKWTALRASTCLAFSITRTSQGAEHSSLPSP